MGRKGVADIFRLRTDQGANCNNFPMKQFVKLIQSLANSSTGKLNTSSYDKSHKPLLLLQAFVKFLQKRYGDFKESE